MGWNRFLDITILDDNHWFQIQQIAKQAAQILIAIAIVKIGVPLVEIGQYEVWLWIGAIFSLVWMSGWLQNLLIEYHKNQNHPAFFASILYTSIVLQIVFLILICNPISLGFLTNQEVPHYWIFVFAISLNNIALLTPHMLFLTNRKLLLRSYTIWSTGLFLIVMTSAVIIKPTIHSIAIAYASYGMILFCYLLWTTAMTSNLTWDFSLTQTQMRLAVPLVLYAGVGAGARYFDEWFINLKFADPQMFVLFKYGARELPIIMVLTTSFSSAMIREFQKK